MMSEAKAPPAAGAHAHHGLLIILAAKPKHDQHDERAHKKTKHERKEHSGREAKR
jgi:hypothetical protein